MDKRRRTAVIAGGVLFALAVILFILPVGYNMTAIVLAGLAAVIVFFALCRRRPWRIAVCALLLIGLGCFFSAEIPVIRGAHSDENTDAPYLVVMGAGIRGTTPSLSMADRLTAALAWLGEHPDAAVIVSGSQAKDEITSEAAVMYAWLLDRGIAPERVIVEDQADSTLENIRNSLALIEHNGGDPAGRVAFVSSEYHLCRIRLLAEYLGCEGVCIAAPTSEFTMKINLFIREAFALWQIRVFGPGA